MKNGLILLLLLCSLVALGKDKHKPVKIPVSRWKETKRMAFDSTVQAFTDTLYITFRRKDSFAYHYKDGFMYSGGYTIDEDSLIDFGTAKFKLILKRPATLVLADDKLLHIMRFDISDTVKADVIEKEDSLLPVKDLEAMTGHWTVYKKVTDKLGDAIDFATELKSVYITGPSSDGKQGYVYSGLDASNHPTWYIKGLGADQTLECAGKSARAIRIIKCQKGEMILEDDGIKYYLKQFK